MSEKKVRTGRGIARRWERAADTLQEDAALARTRGDTDGAVRLERAARYFRSRSRQAMKCVSK